MSDLIDTSKEDKNEKKVEDKRKRDLSDIRFVIKSPEGRRFYWRVMMLGKVFHDPFAQENTNLTHYNLGRQSVSRDFLNDLLEAKPEAFTQMQNEQASEAKSEEIINEKEQEKSSDLI